MRKLPILALFLVIALWISLLSPNVFAQSSSPLPPKPGWGIGDPNNIHLGPPGLSIRPIHSPQEIPALRAQIQQYLLTIRAYIAGLFNSNTG